MVHYLLESGENKSLAAIPLGLSVAKLYPFGLSMPSIDMKKVETAIFFRQIVNQGPARHRLMDEDGS